MNSIYVFESERLGFRLWEDKDKLPFAKMNSNGEVMRYFPKILTIDESNMFIQRIMQHFSKYGYGLWAVELKDTGEFIGFIGFYTATFQAEFTPCIEIGWRLDNKYWGNGYATEGALKCLEYGFNHLKLDKIYSFTSCINTASINVMKKIGMVEEGEFQHPNIYDNNELKPHKLYMINLEK